MRKIVSVLLFVLPLLAGCDQILSGVESLTSNAQTKPSEKVPTHSVTSTSQLIPALETLSSAATAEVSTPTAESASGEDNVLKLWLPPQFDPSSGTPAGEILKARLQAFIEEHPGVQIQVRIKALEGPGGLLDSLVTASVAAPGALPDVIALSRPLLEKAALRGLVYSYNGLTTVLNQQDWYEYARELAHLQQSTFGLPFAGDALVLVYQPVEAVEPPATWNRLLEYPGLLAFPASDPEALFTLAQYQALGGKVQDEQGRPMLDEQTLSEVLSIYINAVQAGRMTDYLSQYATLEQVWRVYREGQFTVAITWTSLYLSAKDAQAVPIPTPSDAPYTLTTGWSWALASPQSEKRVMGVKLAEFLVDNEFLARWSQAGNFLPPRASALELWEPESSRWLIGDISASAHLIPSGDILSRLGPVLQQAVLQVLRQEKTSQEAAQAAVNSLKTP